MAPRIVIIGGGSNQWVPKLVTDFVNTKSLHGAEIVLEDVNPRNLDRMVDFVHHCARLRKIPMTARATTDQRDALEGADFVVVSISTGGFASMRHDLEIPARYGLFQTVGDTVGPGGIIRGLRNIPVMLDIARDMEQICPDAWMLSLTNPMTTLCRAVTQETSVKTVGLCHEVTIISAFMSMLLGTDFRAFDPVITGLNHIPLFTAVDIAGQDGFELLRAWLDDPPDLDERLPFDLPAGLGHRPLPDGRHWTKRDLLDINRVKVEFFKRFGALPGANDRHIVEFFPGFLMDEADFESKWNVHLTTIEEREMWEKRFSEQLDAMIASDEVSHMPSGEMLAHLIDSLMGGRPRNVAVNIPNAGQSPDLGADVIVESMCIADDSGVRARDRAVAPVILGEYLRRISSSQELAVHGALTGDRNSVFQAMLADPMASRLEFTALERMTNEMLDATKAWLPQFN